MKLPVTSAGADPDSLWRRFADLLFDRALARGEELTLPLGRGVAAGRADWIFPSAGPEDELIQLAAFQQRYRRPTVWIQPPGGPECGVTLGRYFPAAVRTDYTLHRLRQATSSDDLSPVAVLPGRAARAAYAQLCDACYVESGRLTEADVAAHLDDPHFDPLVVVDRGAAVAMAGLQTRGQTGAMFDVYVRPDHRRRGLGTMLVGRVIELAARSQHVDLFAACESDGPGRAVLARCGFTALTRYAVWTTGVATPDAA